MLRHYDAVVWYTGDDDLTRRTGQPAGTGTARLAVEEMIDVRHFLDEGGKLFFTGKSAGQQWAEGNEFRNFGFAEPPGGRQVVQTTPRPSSTRTTRPRPTAASPTTTTSSSTTWAPTSTPSPGNTFDDEAGHPFAMRGTGPFDGLSWMFDETGANNQDHSATFVVT